MGCSVEFSDSQSNCGDMVCIHILFAFGMATGNALRGLAWYVPVQTHRRGDSHLVTLWVGIGWLSIRFDILVYGYLIEHNRARNRSGFMKRNSHALYL